MAVTLFQHSTYVIFANGCHKTVEAFEWTEKTETVVDDSEDNMDAITYGFSWNKPGKIKQVTKLGKGNPFLLMVAPSSKLKMTVFGYNTSTEVIVDVERLTHTDKTLDKFRCLLDKKTLLELLNPS